MKTLNAPNMDLSFPTVNSFPWFLIICNGFQMIFWGFEWFRKGSKVQIYGSGWFPWFLMFLYGLNDVVDDLHNCFNMFHGISSIVIGVLWLPKVFRWLLLFFNRLWWRSLISYGFKWLSRFPTIFNGVQ